MVARLARRLARGGLFRGLDALPLALLGGFAFGLGRGRGRCAGAWPSLVVDARPGAAGVVGGLVDHLDGELGLRYAAAAAVVAKHLHAVRGRAHGVTSVHQIVAEALEMRELILSGVQRLQHAMGRYEDDEREDHDADEHSHERAAPPRPLI